MSVEARPSKTPPEPRFWQRYSARHELPLSSVGSLTLHVLALAAVVLFAVGAFHSYRSTDAKMGFDIVELERTGEQKQGAHVPLGNRGDGLREQGDGEAVVQPPVQLEQRLAPTAAAPADVQVEFSPVGSLKVVDPSGALKNIGENIARKPPRGPIGTTNSLPGDPNGNKASLSQERRFRWHLNLNIKSGADYVRQLQGLRATLAIPTGPGNPPPGYWVIRSMSERPVQLVVGDVSQLPGISWLDDRPDSVTNVVSALGLNVQPSHFRAYFQPDFESQLLRAELQWARKHGLTENQIDGTWFSARETATGWEPFVVHQTRKR